MGSILTNCSNELKSLKDIVHRVNQLEETFVKTQQLYYKQKILNKIRSDKFFAQEVAQKLTAKNSVVEMNAC